MDTLIREFSKHIGLEWKFLARSLRFSDTNIDALEYANQLNLKEQIYQFFRQWKQREGNNASPLKLIEAAEDECLKELLETLKDNGFIHSSGSVHGA